MKIKLSTHLINESIASSIREEHERKLGSLPFWFYPIALVSFGVPFATLILIVLG